MQFVKCAYIVLLLVSVFFVFTPSGSFAADASANKYSELEKVPCRVVNFITGTWGKIIATIVIIFSAFMMLFGKLSIPLGLVLVAALAMLFGAESVLSKITGKTEDSCETIVQG